MPDITREETQVIDQIFNEAQRLSPDARPGFLEKACAGHRPVVGVEVDRLLLHDQQAQKDRDLLERPEQQLGEISATSPQTDCRKDGHSGDNARAPSAAADRNLFFGISALQFDFIDRHQLITAMHAWVLAKHRPLGEILVEQRALDPSDRQMLEAMVDRNLDLHNHDAQQSLARLSSVSSLHDDLRALGDLDLERTLTVVSDLRDADSRSTEPWAHGSSTGKRFRVLRHYREGGMGKVSYAQDAELNREVALKQIKDKYADDPASRARFVFEAEITGGLQHPGVVPVYGLGQDDQGRPFYAMRFIDGDRLTDAIARFHNSESHDRITGERAIEFRDLLKRFVDVCDAVGYAHSRGVLHRDLKPQNIMLGKYGETLVVDWGLAKVVGREERLDQKDEQTLRPPSVSGSAPTLSGSAHGTVGYMSPEQASGRVNQLGRATDVYSLGSILYTVLTGKPPFKSSQEDVLDKIVRGEFASPRSLRRAIPAPLEAICLKCLSAKPADRYQSAAEISRDVERWLADEPVSVFPEPWLDLALRTVRRHETTVVGGAAVIFSALLALTAIAVITNRQNTVLRARNNQLRIARDEAKASRSVAESERTKADDLRLKADAEANKAREASSVSIEVLDNFVKGLADDKWAAVPQLEGERIRMVDLAVARYSKLLDESPGDVRLKLDVVQVLVRSGNLYRMTGQHAKAERQIERAIAIIDEIPSLTANDAKAGLLSDTLFSLTAVTVSRRGAQEAFPACDRNLAIARRRLESNPDSLLAMLGLGRVLLQHCELYLDLSQAAAAEGEAREAADMFLKLATPLDSQFVVHVFHSYAYTLLAKACLVQSKWNDAETAVDRAVKLGRDAAAKFSDNNNVTDFAEKAVIERGRYLLATGDFEQGKATLLNSLAIYRNLSDDFPQTDGYQRVQVEVTNILATESLKHEAKAEALDYARTSLSLIKQLSGDEAPIAKYLPLQIEALAVLILASTDAEAKNARAQLDEARGALEKLNPHHPLLASDLLRGQ